MSEPAGGDIGVAPVTSVLPRVLFLPRPAAPLQPDVAHDLPRYCRWVADRQAHRLASQLPPPRSGPRITWLLALEAADPDLLARGLGSLACQTSDRWDLAVCSIGPLESRACAVLEDTVPGSPSRSVTVTTCEVGTSLPAALGLALAAGAAPGLAAGATQGDSDSAVAVLGQHDELAPDAVAQLSRALSQSPADFVYADDDDIAEPDHDHDHDGGSHDGGSHTGGSHTGGSHGGGGELAHPRLKPDWSPEFLLSTNYIGRPWVLRRALLDASGGFRAFDPGDGDWEHDLVLRATDKTRQVAHVTEVLYHRRMTAAPPMTGVGWGPVADALARRGETATVTPGRAPGTWAIQRRPVGRPKVSVIIPFRDSNRFLRTCTDSIRATSGDMDIELVLVDNGSTEPETLSLIDRLADQPDTLVVRDPRPFNWAALNNAAAAIATGDVLLFLNDDTEARGPGWLQQLSAQALRPDVAVAGARLLYPDGTLQHVGVVIGGGAAGHVLAHLDGDRPGYLSMAMVARDCTAVIGACLATRSELFHQLAGFDEALGLDLNETDYCLRARARGYRVVIDPLAELIHHESPTRGTSGSIPDIITFLNRWDDVLASGDPFLSPHLTRIDSSCALRAPDEEEFWQQWRSTLLSG